MQPDLSSLVRFLKEARTFQHTFRFTPHPDGRWENDAEHSWAVALTVMLLASRLEKEFSVTLDHAKMLKMALIHDLAEIDTGDTKTWDSKARVGKEERERAAMERLSGLLPSDVRDELLALWEECEKKETLEAKIVKSLDRLDPVLHRTAFKVGWENVVEEAHATADSLDARQLPRHTFSKTIMELYRLIRDEAVAGGLFKTKG